MILDVFISHNFDQRGERVCVRAAGSARGRRSGLVCEAYNFVFSERGAWDVGGGVDIDNFFKYAGRIILLRV